MRKANASGSGPARAAALRYDGAGGVAGASE